MTDLDNTFLSLFSIILAACAKLRVKKRIYFKNRIEKSIEIMYNGIVKVRQSNNKGQTR